MAKNTRRHLDQKTARKLSDLAHLAFIEALTHVADLSPRQLAFHGGTSLHLSWKSPRFSEDLDFLLDRAQRPVIEKMMRKIETRMRSVMRNRHPDLEPNVRISDKTREGDNLLNYRVTVSSPRLIGNVKVKAEFWQVDSDYLRHYDTRFAYPLQGGDLVTSVSQPLPAASLEAAYADKLTAFATRRFLKWRDVFDTWWIGRQIEIDPARMADRFLHHVTAFDTVEGLSPEEALRRFLERTPEEIGSEADPDLKRWLPGDLWNRLSGPGIAEIIETVRTSIEAIAAEIEARNAAPREEEMESDANTPDIGA